MEGGWHSIYMEERAWEIGKEENDSICNNKSAEDQPGLFLFLFHFFQKIFFLSQFYSSYSFSPYWGVWLLHTLRDTFYKVR